MQQETILFSFLNTSTHLDTLVYKITPFLPY